MWVVFASVLLWHQLVAKAANTQASYGLQLGVRLCGYAKIVAVVSFAAALKVTIIMVPAPNPAGLVVQFSLSIAQLKGFVLVIAMVKRRLELRLNMKPLR